MPDAALDVRRQVKTIDGKLYYALPKSKMSRIVDMPSSVAEALTQHMAEYPPVEAELPWGRPGGDVPTKRFPLLLTTRFHNAVAVNTWNTYTWKPALAEAGIIPPRRAGAKQWQWEAAPNDGFHVLRHTYASIMLEAGEAGEYVVTVARWMGHRSPTVTLDYYAHFMPEAGNKGRAAIDGLIGAVGEWAVGRNSPDSPQG
ncbi:hypothetical protein [Streptomyces sp. NPDC088246]|uniref:hypothetical protein n=1 Tax=Streptomyces sp. NPDC088246 TaxID=3365842 RepID=UPI00380FD52F